MLKHLVRPSTTLAEPGVVMRLKTGSQEIASRLKKPDMGLRLLCFEDEKGETEDSISFAQLSGNLLEINIFYFFVKGEFNKQRFLETLFHEGTHYYATTYHSEGSSPHMESGVLDFPTPLKKDRKWTPLNEALTELFGQTLYKEYLLQSGKKYDQANLNKYVAYERHILYFSRIVARIKKELGVPAEVVVSAFIHSYLNRLSFSKLFEELKLNEETLQEIRNMETDDSFKPIYEAMATPNPMLSSELRRQKEETMAAFSSVIFDRTNYYQKKYDLKKDNPLGEKQK